MVGVEGQRIRRTKDEELGQIERGGELKKTWKHSLRECTLNNTQYILIKIICKHVCGYLLYMCQKALSIYFLVSYIWVFKCEIYALQKLAWKKYFLEKSHSAMCQIL